MDSILHFAICLMTQDFGLMRLWKLEFLLRFLAFFNFLYFFIRARKRHLKNNIFYTLSPGLPYRKKLCLLSESPHLAESIILGACIPCTRIQTAFGFMCLEFTLGSTWYLWPDYT